VRLFERDQRRVLLTPGGKALVERARALLIAADELLEAGRVLSDPLAGTLRLGLIPTIAPYLLPEVAPGLRKALPKLHFAWVEEKTSELLERLDRADLDGAVLALLADLESMPHIVLGKDPFVLAAPQGHPLVSSGRPLRPGDLEGERIFLLDDGHCFRDQALAFCTRVGAEEAGYRATSLSTLVQLTAGGAGVTLLPKMAVGVENRRASLRLRAFGESGPSRMVWPWCGARGRPWSPPSLQWASSSRANTPAWPQGGRTPSVEGAGPVLCGRSGAQHRAGGAGPPYCTVRTSLSVTASLNGNFES
jgi:LysR family hydrogen peroxide-inducible transcriptional activator